MKSNYIIFCHPLSTSIYFHYYEILFDSLESLTSLYNNPFVFTSNLRVPIYVTLSKHESKKAQINLNVANSFELNQYSGVRNNNDRLLNPVFSNHTITIQEATDSLLPNNSSNYLHRPLVVAIVNMIAPLVLSFNVEADFRSLYFCLANTVWTFLQYEKDIDTVVQQFYDQVISQKNVQQKISRMV